MHTVDEVALPRNPLGTSHHRHLYVTNCQFLQKDNNNNSKNINSQKQATWRWSACSSALKPWDKSQEWTKSSENLWTHQALRNGLVHVLLLEEGHMGAHVGEEGHHVRHGGRYHLELAAREKTSGNEHKWWVGGRSGSVVHRQKH